MAQKPIYVYRNNNNPTMKLFGLLLLVILLIGCGTGGKAPAVSGLVSLDEALAEAAADVEERLEPGVIIALLNFSSPSERFSEYVLEGLSEHLVNGGKLVVVERNQLDLIRQEEQFQLSGEVSDESAQAIGKKLGAQMIVSGTLSDVGKKLPVKNKNPRCGNRRHCDNLVLGHKRSRRAGRGCGGD